VVLALAVTVIEVGLIVSLMTNDTPGSETVARDTVFAAVIIVTNGILGCVCCSVGCASGSSDFMPAARTRCSPCWVCWRA
jgi:Ca2+/H+ antiporter